MVLTVSFVLSPAIGLLSPSSALLLADLTPASRRQNHTTSPSTPSAGRLTALSASTASRPASVTIAKRPSVGRDGERYIADLGQAKTEIFLQMGLDRRSQRIGLICPSGKMSRCARNETKRSGHIRSRIALRSTRARGLQCSPSSLRGRCTRT